jgi:hypothetical protein
VQLYAHVRDPWMVACGYCSVSPNRRREGQAPFYLRILFARAHIRVARDPCKISQCDLNDPINLPVVECRFSDCSLQVGFLCVAILKSKCKYEYIVMDHMICQKNWYRCELSARPIILHIIFIYLFYQRLSVTKGGLVACSNILRSHQTSIVF